MAVQGKEAAPSYEEFDSSEFEAEPAEAQETETKEGDEKEAKEEKVDGRKLTPEEAFGGDDKVEDTETKADDAAATETKTDAASDDAGEQEEKPAYEPNHKYTAYGQEKEFPEQLKKLVQDKETEDYVRGLLSKADGLDEMKPRHQETVRERDTYKSELDGYKSSVNRIIELRDKQPHLFAAEIGISDDWIIKVARELVKAKESPEAWDSFTRTRQSAAESYTAASEAARATAAAQETFNSSVREQMNTALSHPDVVTFQSQFDAVHGIGAFREEVRKHGFYHYEKTAREKGRGENLAPMEAVNQVYQFHKKAFAPPAPHVEAKPAEKKAPVVTKEKPKPIPNIGKGKNVSPVGSRRFKNLKEMRAYVDKHVGD